MLKMAYHLGLTCSVAWALSPRIFRYADKRVTRKRFRIPHAVQVQHTTATATSAEISPADFCEALARSLRSGINSSAAFHSHAARTDAPSIVHSIAQQYVHEAHLLEDVLTVAHSDASGTLHESFTLYLLLSCQAGTLHPAALSLAAQCLRDEESLKAQLHVGTAHAHITARILTSLPLACLLFGCLVSSSLRQSFSSVGTCIVLMLGVALNVMGWLWMHRLATSISTTSPHAEYQRFTFAFCVALHAGHSHVSACSTWRHVSPIGAHIAQQLADGSSLRVALAPLADHFGQPGQMLSQTITESVESGTPVVSVATRLLSDARSESRRHAEFQLRQLPTKLALPIVFCVLPAFLLIALMPFVMAGLTSLSSSTFT